MNSPMDLRLLFAEKIKGMDSAIRGMENAAILTLNPKSEMIQAVTVVPILAPIITVMDCSKVSNPAFTKLTTITVVADED